MSDIVNPYIAGNPITGSEMFFGREDIFRFIGQALVGRHRDNVVVLYGQRRTGKTSILYQMRHHLDERYLCIFIDLHSFALQSLAGFLWELANHIMRVLRRDYQLTLPRLNQNEFMNDPRGSFEGEFLNLMWSACGDRHLLLMIDEAVRLLEQVRAGALEHEVFEYMRHLMQHYERLNFLFALGSGLEELEKEYSFLFSVGLYKKISFLNYAAVSALITQPVKDYYDVEPAAVERIIQITSGHPYYTQLLCHSLFNLWQQRRVTRIQAQNIDEILDEVVERGLAVLKHVWEESTAGEKATMAAIAAVSEQNAPIAGEVINRVWIQYGIFIPKGEMAKSIQGLTARDIIVGQDPYRFTVALQSLWVHKYRRLEWVEEEISHAFPTVISTQDLPATMPNAPFISLTAPAISPQASQTPPLAPSAPISIPALPLIVPQLKPEHQFPRRAVLFGGLGLVGIAAAGELAAWIVNSRHSPASANQPTADPTPVSDPTYVTYRGHTNQVYAVAWGQHIASGGKDNIVRVWDPIAPAGKDLYVFLQHSGSVNAIAWSPGKMRIASGGSDAQVIVWDALTGNHLLRYRGHKDNIRTVAWSPNGRYIASAGDDTTVQVWEAATATHVCTYKNHEANVWSIAWLFDSSRIASASADKTVQVWDATTGQNILIYHGHTGTNAVKAVAWSPDGHSIASGSDKPESAVHIWDASTLKTRLTYSEHSNGIYALAWSQGGQRIASGSWYEVRVWNPIPPAGKTLNTYNDHTGAVHAVAWSPDGLRIVSGADDALVRIWQAI